LDLPVRYASLSAKKKQEARLEYIGLQEGRCWFCKGSFTEPPPSFITQNKINESLFPKGFLSRPIHLHHDHNSGLTIGAVHAYCNAVLWQYLGE
jgi:hypothetical protein